MSEFRFSLNELSVGRVASAISRRVKDVPDRYAWRYSEVGQRNRNELAQFRGKHKGQRCVVICNGPSLNRTDMGLVRGEHSICMNRAYLMFDKWGFTPTYFAASAEQVLTQFNADIRGLAMPKFVDFKYRSLYPPSENSMYLRLPPSLKDEFRADLTDAITGGGTVTFVVLQIAFYLGFETVVIIGMDHRFSAQGIPTTTEVRTSEVDHDHVHPNYFPKGVKWQLPDLRRSEGAYQLAKVGYRNAGRRIIDATVDGACTVFDKASLDQALAG